MCYSGTFSVDRDLPKMALRFPFALYAPSLKEQVYSYPWYLITEIICVGRMYMYLLMWSPSYPSGTHTDGSSPWKSVACVCSCVFVSFLPRCHFAVFLHRDWKLAFEVKVLIALALTDIAYWSPSSFLLTPELGLEILCQELAWRGLVCHHSAILRHLASLRR